MLTSFKELQVVFGCVQANSTGTENSYAMISVVWNVK